MEVGAVKQAFNNEVIQLKKNLNQAKIQVIHKLTRKAKTLTEKKTADHLKEKNKKKAESAVREVLIMKKLKPRDIARFIITYKGELNSHLNKPTVDSDKACARLLLHKALQQKYKSIKDKFGDIPIKDLLMSRQERRKLKKEAKDAQKNKKKGKEKVVNSQGDWDVENMEVSEDNKEKNKNDDSTVNDERSDNDVSDNGDQDDVANDGQDISDDEDDTPVTRHVVNGSDESNDDESEIDDLGSHGGDSDDESMVKENSSTYEGQDSDEEIESKTENTVKLKLDKQEKPLKTSYLILKHVQPATANIKDVLPKQKKNPDKKVKENKNKNLNEKMQNRKFKRDKDDCQNVAKVIDPFFKTASGESYMSVAEPRQPDEVKEVHRQGNRQERRAVMFGRAPMRPRRNDRQNFRSDKLNNRNGNSSTKFNNYSNDREAKFNGNNFNGRNSNFNDRNSKFNDNNSNFNGKSHNSAAEPKEEKLHPSWEAKKKQSGILPFKGKKIVFDES